MLDIKEIEYWISRYEQEADKLDQCVTLSALYAIQDRMRKDSDSEHAAAAYSDIGIPVSETLGQYGDSDFLRAVAGVPAADAWTVMDELMETLAVVNHRAYESVIRKLNRL